MKNRIALASNGDIVDQHFGSARIFQIYDIKDGAGVFVEARQTAAKCQGECEGGFNHLLSALKDCEAVFVLKIGPAAAAFMAGHNKRVFEAMGGIDEIIAEIVDTDLLAETGQNNE